MTALEILKAARELIADPARWTQGEDARGEDMRSRRFYEDDAVCWCAVGATGRADTARDSAVCERGRAADDELEATLRSLGYGGPIVEYNDEHSHAEVLALFDATIARLEAEQQP